MGSLLDRAVKKIESAKALDRFAKPLADAADKAISSRALIDLLSGKQVGHPVHPLMVTVPIGAFTTVGTLDWLPSKNREAYEKTSKQVLALGILSSLPAAVAGVNDWRYTQGADRRVGLVHASFNTAALLMFSMSLSARARNRHAVGRAYGVAGMALISVGGYLGGHLSYASGVGVDTNAFLEASKNWKVVANADEVDESLKRVECDGVPVLLTRIDGRVTAMSNRCSHRSGPLSEGERRNDCVVCPWHDSAFSLKDGTVVDGPAVRPQPIFDVRVVDGQVEVRQS